MPAKGSLSNPEGTHLSEPNFRKMESYLQDFVDAYPEAYVFRPIWLKPITVASYFRHAVNAALSERYETTINLPKLKEAWSAVTLRVKGDKVVVANSQEHTNATVSLARVAQQQEAVTFTINNPTVRTLDGLCILILEQALTIPVILTGSVPQYSLPPGVVMEPNPDGSFTML